MLTKRSALTLLAGALALAGTALPALAQAPEKLKVVATFSILGDIVKNVGGDRIEVKTLVGPNGDAHVYSPTPADAKSLTEAKVVFTNGLKFEGWIARLIRSSGTKAPVVEAAGGVKALDGDDDHGQGHDHAHDHGALDPHAWQNVANARIYALNVRDALIRADEAGKAAYEANAAAYVAQLDALDADIKALVSRIPADKRRIITSHDAFRYFEAAYGIDFVSPQGVSTESEASAKDVATIIRQIKKDRISAIFVENISDPRLMERVAKETGARIGEPVFSDALSDASGPAGTYIDLMRHNIKAFSTALSS
ncbi:metal ABC transporter substrate-binding protein [Microvirga pudoricolor]|uniref:metal ABC transporter substrate-binding protein n=1 Tax=Microvirga pudoricolor TaxID=2778729 RepID=UPI00194F7E24|nr:metal ABC transporter substrate-binding protein [Microvirga pudoricolor]MBM6594894.1 metal ABC transporter substrate-binding protein [Microvirga pudoricolor]